jgi:ferredoxin
MMLSMPNYTVTIEPQGWQFFVEQGETVLQAATRQSIDLPSSCQNGTCRACYTPEVKGRVYYEEEWPGVSREEQEAGDILPCIARPVSDLVMNAPWAKKISLPTQG